MEYQYLTLPLQLGGLIKKSNHSRIGLKQSIAQNLHLILTTSLGEMGTDINFGCVIWEEDFKNVSSNNQRKEKYIHLIKESIQTYESRIENIQVQIYYDQEETLVKKNNVQVKKKLRIEIKSYLKLTNEEILYQDSFYISPLAYM